MARIIMSWQKALIFGKLCEFREVTRFAKVIFLFAVGPLSNIDQRVKMQPQTFMKRHHDLEGNFVQVRACQAQSFFKKNESQSSYILVKCH